MKKYLFLTLFCLCGILLAQEITFYRSAQAENSALVKTSGARLMMVVGYNSSSSDQFIHIHNLTAQPVNGTVPFIAFKAVGSRNFSYEIPEPGLPMSTGIVICNSTNLATTVIGTSNCFFYVNYR